MQKYEYKIVRINMPFLSIAGRRYHDELYEQAKLGWRLLQILVPPVGVFGFCTFFELVFEKLYEATDKGDSDQT